MNFVEHEIRTRFSLNFDTLLGELYFVDTVQLIIITEYLLTNSDLKIRINRRLMGLK